jgi:DNA-binding MarR family transcriptional regulator
VKHAAIREKHEGAFASDRENLRLWLRLLSCTTVVEKRLRRRLAQRGCTLPRFDIMAALDRHPEGMTMGALSRALLVSNGNVTGLVKMLAAEGLVQIKISPTDRRACVVHLTRRGHNNFEELAASHHDWIDAMFAKVPRDERRQLFALLGSLKASIAQDRTEEGV